ncbi:hypothetical protein [Lysobacter gummosus]|uniref:hypothetical protein n=1 Tax=Lysobacter gummosus TaxID=262324 RepID=UPI0036340EC8
MMGRVSGGRVGEGLKRPCQVREQPAKSERSPPQAHHSRERGNPVPFDQGGITSRARKSKSLDSRVRGNDGFVATWTRP